MGSVWILPLCRYDLVLGHHCMVKAHENAVRIVVVMWQHSGLLPRCIAPAVLARGRIAAAMSLRADAPHDKILLMR